MKCNCKNSSTGNTTIRCCNSCGLPLPMEPWEIKILKMLNQMASTEDPFGLFEPKLWKDKLGDSLWHCAISSVDGYIIETTGKTMEEVIENCYNKMIDKDID